MPNIIPSPDNTFTTSRTSCKVPDTPTWPHFLNIVAATEKIRAKSLAKYTLHALYYHAYIRVKQETTNC